ncbi:MAG: hypothetical protein GIS02_04590 [Methanosarcinales archaeon]|uniref:Glycine zipper domain-containing protein n=1 Tax=Candidatus Ethanoperedens thermophilum TaxID=2766897 RepID=A0A848DB11_9EURY|nr:hypothetical protein [Candidatus Ethanoperedens thermophilum]
MPTNEKPEEPTSGGGALLGMIAGGALGLLGGPVGVIVGGVIGAILGNEVERGEKMESR